MLSMYRALKKQLLLEKIKHPSTLTFLMLCCCKFSGGAVSGGGGACVQCLEGVAS